MKILMVGDAVGRPGRRTFAARTAQLKKERAIDLVIINGENSAGGRGITRESMDELIAGGADIVTTGNHVWDRKEVKAIIDVEPYLVRPANYPEGAPGKGYCIYPHKYKTVGVMNLSGRTFMDPMDCPFQKADEILRELNGKCDIIILDFHAEATSEKQAMGYYLDGRVNAVIGTHTHIQTADERILPKGTAYITDLGMVGARDSILGVKVECILDKFLHALPVKFDVAEGKCIYNAVIIDIDDATNKTVGIERICLIDE